MRLPMLRRLPAAAPAVPLQVRASSSSSGSALPLMAPRRRRQQQLQPQRLGVAGATQPPVGLLLPARGLTTARRREEAEGAGGGKRKGGGGGGGGSGGRPRKSKEDADLAATGEEGHPSSGGGVAIDNTGLLDGYHHGDPPSPRQIALHVRGARLQGGNVVWRAPGATLKEPVGDAGLGLGLGLASASASGGQGQQQQQQPPQEGAAVDDGGPSVGGGDTAASASSREALWERANATVSMAAKDTPHRHLNEPPDFRSLGVIEPEKELDLQLMIQNYTVPALAAGLRDREETLQLCARLLADGDLAQLEKVLHPYQAGLINRRRRKTRSLDLQGGLTSQHLNMLRKYLQRSPRHLTRAVSLRASVVIPLCNVDGVASLLFERRSAKVRSFKNQVCFPGGMVEEARDVNIIETSLREMEEEIGQWAGFPAKQVDVLGVLRCDWSEVHKITGIGVTPVVGFLGDLTERTLAPNPDEVSECFTVPLATLLKEEHWNDDKENATVVFVGGPHIVWGLTAYICRKFITDILCRYKITT